MFIILTVSRNLDVQNRERSRLILINLGWMRTTIPVLEKKLEWKIIFLFDLFDRLKIYKEEKVISPGYEIVSNVLKYLL